ncbi:hypothetical protein CLV47_108118 [Antricoccus suffuscus]|uniref:Uncharacterized protein n=1 Tax=Antricoccus suffuscus TaxID=1629062 RepID=A0A2T0ZZH2_9ACTN|nr:hypothetical protein [Antricoccus suffuscus]PRZ41759.1 hypothetical protein CLV47_108118 [Antricoccus suffuscus]
MDRDTAVVYPVGYFAGYFGAGTDDQTRSIRRGWEPVCLTQGIDFEFWAAAHGSLSHDWSVPWTVGQVVQSLRNSVEGRDPWTAGIVPARADLYDIAANEAIARLLDYGLLALVGDSSEERTAFAKTHRFDPMLLGLGNTATRPDRSVIGLRDRPVMQMPESQIEFWQMSNQFDSIWDACECIAGAVTEGPYADAPPATLVPQVLSDIRAYIAHGAGYLDVVVRERHRPVPPS